MSEFPLAVSRGPLTPEMAGESSRNLTSITGETSFVSGRTEQDVAREGLRIIVSETIRPVYDDAQPYSGVHRSSRIDQCRRLVANRYLEEGYITESDLDDEGHLNEVVDPYVSDAEYFWRVNDNGDVIATLRIIHPYDQETPLPIERAFDLFPEQRQVLHQMRKDNPNSVVEISALAKADGVDRRAALDMYKAVWQHARRTGLELCVLSADIRLHDMLIDTFGEAFQEAGEPAMVMGSLTVPSLLYPDKCAQALVKIYQKRVEEGKSSSAASYKKLIAYLSDGLEARYLSSEELRALESIGLQLPADMLTIDNKYSMIS